MQRAAVVLGGLEQRWQRRFAFTAHDAVERALPVRHELARDERGAVPAGEHERVGQARADRPGELEHLGHVREVVERETDGFGPELLEQAEQVRMTEHLQVEQPDVVSLLACGLGHHLEPERLEPQIQLRVHQDARVHQEDAHLASAWMSLGRF